MLNFWRKKQENKNSSEALQRLSNEFQRSFSGKLTWQWDERFDTALLHVDRKNKEKVVKVLEKHFSDYWNILFDEEMPDSIQQQVQRFDGLRPEQLLFSTDMVNDKFLYCAWWPWQDGEKTSVRIGLFTNGDSEQEEVNALLKQAFLS